MSEIENFKIESIDENGNFWKICVESLPASEKGNTNRSELRFYFNEKSWKLQTFSSKSSRNSVWEFIKFISKKEIENAKNIG
jgi:hypothetical protein